MNVVMTTSAGRPVKNRVAPRRAPATVAPRPPGGAIFKFRVLRVLFPARPTRPARQNAQAPENKLFNKITN